MVTYVYLLYKYLWYLNIRNTPYEVESLESLVVSYYGAILRWGHDLLRCNVNILPELITYKHYITYIVYLCTQYTDKHIGEIQTDVLYTR